MCVDRYIDVPTVMYMYSPFLRLKQDDRKEANRERMQQPAFVFCLRLLQIFWSISERMPVAFLQTLLKLIVQGETGYLHKYCTCWYRNTKTFPPHSNSNVGHKSILSLTSRMFEDSMQKSDHSPVP